jgi:hypothetical protein
MPLPKDTARAAVLTGVLESAYVAPEPFSYRSTPALHESVAGKALPLDLDAAEFRYLVIEESFVIPLRDRLIAPFCRKRHRRRGSSQLSS